MKNKTQLQDIYNKWHKTVYQIDTEKYLEKTKKFYELIMREFGLSESTRDRRLLDIACGKGVFLKEVHSFNENIKLYGSDISDYAINEAKKLVNAEYAVGDGEELSFPDNFFDFVSCIGGLEYFENPVRGVCEMSRVLKKDGTCIIYVPNLMFFGYIWLALRSGMMPTHGGSKKDSDAVYDYNYEKFYTYQGWEDIIRKGGLEIKKCKKYNYIGGTKYINKLASAIYHVFFRHLVPFHLSYCFIFICKKK